MQPVECETGYTTPKIRAAFHIQSHELVVICDIPVGEVADPYSQNYVFIGSLYILILMHKIKNEYALKNGYIFITGMSAFAPAHAISRIFRIYIYTVLLLALRLRGRVYNPLLVPQL
jgi:hypothetical protein